MKRLTTKEFIRRAKKVHNNFYTYPRAIYTGANKLIIITHPTHGDYIIRASRHLYGHGHILEGRKRRGLKQRKSHDDFIKEVKAIHGNSLDLSKTKYVTKRQDVIVVDTLYGELKIKAAYLLRGCGHPKRSDKKRGRAKSLTGMEVFFEMAAIVHDGRYDYSSFKYINNKTKGKVIDPKHGPFYVSPSNHLSGTGYNVHGSGFKVRKPGSFYLYLIKDLNILKFGVCNRKTEIRIKQCCLEHGFKYDVIYDVLFEKGRYALELEAMIRMAFETDVSPIKFDGSTETIKACHWHEIEFFIDGYLKHFERMGVEF